MTRWFQNLCQKEPVFIKETSTNAVAISVVSSTNISYAIARSYSSNLHLFLVVNDIKCTYGNNSMLKPRWNFLLNNTRLSRVMCTHKIVKSPLKKENNWKLLVSKTTQFFLLPMKRWKRMFLETIQSYWGFIY